MILRGGMVFDPISFPMGKRLDILVREGRIVKLSRNIHLEGEPVVDVKGRYIFPGVIDMHVHLREPGQTHKEDIATATLAAAAGGVTTVVAMPNTIPPIDSPQRYREVLSLVREKARVEVLATASLSVGRGSEELTDFEGLAREGCRWLSDDGSSLQDKKIIYEACQKIRPTGQLWIEHPEIAFLAHGYPLHDGKAAQKLGVLGQPREAESLAIWQLGFIAGLVGVRVHFTHLSNWRSVEAVRFLKHAYPDLFTADTCPHYLYFTEEDVIKRNFDPNTKMNPPLRQERDRLALLEGIVDGTIDCLVSDHAPHTEEEKSVGMEKAPFGVIGLETLLSAAYTLFVVEKKPYVKNWLALLTTNPSRILGIDRGRIAEGKKANLTIFDPKERWEVKASDFHSKSHNSIFIGVSLQGRVVQTYVDGKKVYERE